MQQYTINDFEVFEFNHPKPQSILFFAHANGIPTLTYTQFFSELCQKFPLKIICYDARGIGFTKQQPVYSNSWGWDTLVQDHLVLLNEIKKKYPSLTNIILSGHSLGAWLSLLVTAFVDIKKIIIFDPPILPLKLSAIWWAVNLVNRRDLNLPSRKVKKRKVNFENKDAAYQSLKKSSFMKEWNDSAIYDYIESSFEQNAASGLLTLRHLPEWEAHLFEQYPPTPFHTFSKIPKSTRKQMNPIIFVGAQSDTCAPQAGPLVKLFLPKAKWIILPKAKHMFPIEMSTQLIQTLQPYLLELL